VLNTKNAPEMVHFSCSEVGSSRLGLRLGGIGMFMPKKAFFISDSSGVHSLLWPDY